MVDYTKKELRDLILEYYDVYRYYPFLATLMNTFKSRMWGRNKNRKVFIKYIRTSSEIYQLLNKRSKRSMTENRTTVCTIRLSKVRDVMFTESLENVPLYINHVRLGAIARWRLNLGK